MNNFNSKNILLNVDGRTTLPYKLASDVTIKDGQQVNSAFNNAIQQLVDNDLYIEHILNERNKYQPGPDILTKESLEKTIDNYKYWVRSDTNDLSILQKQQIPISSTLQQVSTKEIYNAFRDGRYYMLANDGLYSATTLTSFNLVDTGELQNIAFGNGNQICASYFDNDTHSLFLGVDHVNATNSGAYDKTELYRIRGLDGELSAEQIILRTDTGDEIDGVITNIAFDKKDNSIYLGTTAHSDTYVKYGNLERSQSTGAMYSGTLNTQSIVNEVLLTKEDEVSCAVNAICPLSGEYQDKKIIVGTEEGLLESDNRYSFYELRKKYSLASSVSPTCMYTTSLYDVIGTTKGLYFIKNNSDTYSSPTVYLNNESIVAIIQTNSSLLYVATKTKIYSYNFNLTTPEEIKLYDAADHGQTINIDKVEINADAIVVISSNKLYYANLQLINTTGFQEFSNIYEPINDVKALNQFFYVATNTSIYKVGLQFVTSTFEKEELDEVKVDGKTFKTTSSNATIHEVVQIDDQTYLLTNKGLYTLDFIKINTDTAYINNVRQFGNTLYVCSSKGLKIFSKLSNTQYDHVKDCYSSDNVIDIDIYSNDTKFIIYKTTNNVGNVYSIIVEALTYENYAENTSIIPVNSGQTITSNVKKINIVDNRLYILGNAFQCFSLDTAITSLINTGKIQSSTAQVSEIFTDVRLTTNSDAMSYVVSNDKIYSSDALNNFGTVYNECLQTDSNSAISSIAALNARSASGWQIKALETYNNNDVTNLFVACKNGYIYFNELSTALDGTSLSTGGTKINTYSGGINSAKLISLPTDSAVGDYSLVKNSTTILVGTNNGLYKHSPVLEFRQLSNEVNKAATTPQSVRSFCPYEYIAERRTLTRYESNGTTIISSDILESPENAYIAISSVNGNDSIVVADTYKLSAFDKFEAAAFKSASISNLPTSCKFNSISKHFRTSSQSNRIYICSDKGLYLTTATTTSKLTSSPDITEVINNKTTKLRTTIEQLNLTFTNATRLDPLEKYQKTGDLSAMDSHSKINVLNAVSIGNSLVILVQVDLATATTTTTQTGETTTSYSYADSNKYYAIYVTDISKTNATFKQVVCYKKNTYTLNGINCITQGTKLLIIATGSTDAKGFLVLAEMASLTATPTVRTQTDEENSVYKYPVVYQMSEKYNQLAFARIYTTSRAAEVIAITNVSDIVGGDSTKYNHIVYTSEYVSQNMTLFNMYNSNGLPVSMIVGDYDTNTTTGLLCRFDTLKDALRQSMLSDNDKIHVQIRIDTAYLLNGETSISQLSNNKLQRMLVCGNTQSNSSCLYYVYDSIDTIHAGTQLYRLNTTNNTLDSTPIAGITKMSVQTFLINYLSENNEQIDEYRQYAIIVGANKKIYYYNGNHVIELLNAASNAVTPGYVSAWKIVACAVDIKNMFLVYGINVGASSKIAYIPIKIRDNSRELEITQNSAEIFDISENSNIYNIQYNTADNNVYVSLNGKICIIDFSQKLKQVAVNTVFNTTTPTNMQKIDNVLHVFSNNGAIYRQRQSDYALLNIAELNITNAYVYSIFNINDEQYVYAVHKTIKNGATTYRGQIYKLVQLYGVYSIEAIDSIFYIDPTNSSKLLNAIGFSMLNGKPMLITPNVVYTTEVHTYENGSVTSMVDVSIQSGAKILEKTNSQIVVYNGQQSKLLSEDVVKDFVFPQTSSSQAFDKISIANGEIFAYKTNTDLLYNIAIATNDINKIESVISKYQLINNNTIISNNDIYKYTMLTSRRYFKHMNNLNQTLPIYSIYKINDSEALIGTADGMVQLKRQMLIRNQYLKGFKTTAVQYNTNIEDRNEVFSQYLAIANTNKKLYLSKNKKMTKWDVFIDLNSKLGDTGIIYNVCRLTEFDYLISTSVGLFVTTYQYKLIKEFDSGDSGKINNAILEYYKQKIQEHIEKYHSKNSLMTRINNELMPSDFSEIDRNWQKINNACTIIKNDVVQTIDFNAEKYINAQYKNDTTKDKFEDVESLYAIDKQYKSNMHELYIYVPTTHTNYTEISPTETNLADIESIASKKATQLRIILDIKQYDIQNVFEVQINGCSLPLSVVKDKNGNFKSYILPSIAKFAALKNNVTTTSLQTTEDGNVYFDFYCFGTDAQSIKIMFKAKNKYNVSYKADGVSSGYMEDQTFTVGETQKLNKNCFTKDGSLFTYWTSTLNGEKFADEQEIVSTFDENNKSFTNLNDDTVNLSANFCKYEFNNNDTIIHMSQTDYAYIGNAENRAYTQNNQSMVGVVIDYGE